MAGNWGRAVGVAAVMVCGWASAEPQEVRTAPPDGPEASSWRRNALSLEPLAATTGSLRGAYERALTPNLSLVIHTQLSALGRAGAAAQGGESEDLSTSTFGVGAGPGVQYFFSGSAPEGLWAGGRLELLYELKTFSQRLEGQGLPPGGVEARAYGNAFTYGAAASAGYTALFGGGFMVQLGGELGLTRQTRPTAALAEGPSSQGQVVAAELTTTEFALRPRIALGYAF